jgi:hypothetical protein
MAGVARIPRRRGGLCGLLLILLGAWGGLIPFVGPYFKFAYSPDKTWFYSSGRLYLSILPGAAAVLGGLLIAATRSRAVGTIGGLLGAVGGAWFIVGAPVVSIVLKKTSITPGAPVPHGTTAAGTTSVWMYLETIGFFVGVGILLIFVASIAIGRFSMLSHKDVADDDYDDYPDSGARTPATATAAQYPVSSSTGTFPAASQYPGSQRPFPGEEPTQSQGRVQPSTGQFPAANSPSPFGSTSQFPPTSPSGQYPDSPSS